MRGSAWANVAFAAGSNATRVTTSKTCAASLGTGLKSKREFCDVIIAKVPKDSVAIAIPPHAGTVTLMFDLHNRFTLPAVAAAPALMYARHEAIVSVVKPTGEVINRAAVVREFRLVTDLFDQITGGGRPGGIDEKRGQRAGHFPNIDLVVVRVGCADLAGLWRLRV